MLHAEYKMCVGRALRNICQRSANIAPGICFEGSWSLGMTPEIDRIAQRIARSRETDGYKLWRTQKDLDTELYQLASARQPIPIELARMRAIIAKARALGILQSIGRLRKSTRLWHGISKAASILTISSTITEHFGGRREAAKIDGAIIVRAWNEDTPEAEALWNKD
jgi:hypothetical protein